MENVVLVAPVPLKETDCGLPLAPSVNLRVAERAPAAVGLKTIDAVQLDDAARLVVQVFEPMTKSAAFVPLTAMLLMATAAVVPLASVADCAALLEPTAVEAKVRVDGVAVTAPEVPLVPRPVSVTDCGLPVPVSVNLSTAVRVPAAVGAKRMVAVQLADAARLAPQVF